MEDENRQKEQNFKASGGQTGAEFVKKIRPIGIAFFLLLFASFLWICFSSGLEPVKGYSAPQDSKYYAQSAETLEELRLELDKNFFPYIDGVIDSSVEDGKLLVVTEDDQYIKVRSALLRYYDKDLFKFVKRNEND